MKYKVGDEVLYNGVSGEIILTDESDDTLYPYKVRLVNSENCWLREEDIEAKTYERGLADAWELAKKISLPASRGGLSCDEFAEIFGNIYTNDVFFNLTAEEALAKIEAYKKEKEIKVNSIVENSMGALGVVTRDENTNVYVMWTDGSCGKREKKSLKNTGRTANALTALLRQIKE